MMNRYPSRPSSAFVITNESPPIWFQPMEVFEVSFADMSLSPQHTAAAGLLDDPAGRGVALRFPRFKRRRPDKRPDQATTSLQIAQLFAKQSKQVEAHEAADKFDNCCHPVSNSMLVLYFQTLCYHSIFKLYASTLFSDRNAVYLLNSTLHGRSGLDFFAEVNGRLDQVRQLLVLRQPS
jgi:hypothetical protein